MADLSKVEVPGAGEDLTAAAPEVAVAEVPPELVAQSLGEYVRAYVARIRAGDSGVLPIILAMVVIVAVFQAISPNNVYLSPINLVNLFQQSAVIMVLAMAESFALVLGEIDLSVGFVGACGAAITVQLIQPSTTNWPWPLAIVAGLLFCLAFGAVQGILITRLHLPSFIVTLAGYLVANGLFLKILLFGPFSGYPNLIGQSDNLHTIYNLMWGIIDPVVLIKIGMIAVVAIVVVGICNLNRGVLIVQEGVPWVIPIVLGILGAWTILLQRTKYGRYVYAIGGNPEAARRAGINLALIRTTAFMLCSFTAGIALLLYASYLNGMSNNVQAGYYVLYAVAAAVIGGTSLMGGRGKPLHGVLGGLVIGAI